MLLKTVRIPKQGSVNTISLDVLPEEASVDYVNRVRDQWLKDYDILPVVSEERVIELYQDYTIYRINRETKQVGNFGADIELPVNCVAVVLQHLPEQLIQRPPIYITSDMEAYIISSTGVTVSVINGPAKKPNMVLKSDIIPGKL